MQDKQHKEYFEIIISGVGGQGNVSSGIIIGEAASCYEHKFATMTCTYGTEARGTFAKSDVLIGKNFIDFYECQEPDVILVLHKKAYPKIKDKILQNTMVVVNKNEVDQVNIQLGEVFAFPFSDMAFEIGSLQVINMIALSFIVGKTEFIRKESLVKVVQNKYSHSKIAKLNMTAIEYGFRLLG
jgi:2-oxoglutarate ferredoxin oxidoreductase subunit gamma